MADIFGNPDLVQILSQGVQFLSHTMAQAQQVQMQKQNMLLREKEQADLMKAREQRLKMEAESLKIREEQLALSQQAEQRRAAEGQAEQAVRERTVAVAEKREERLANEIGMPTSADMFTPQERASAKFQIDRIDRTIARQPLQTVQDPTMQGLTRKQIEASISETKTALSRATTAMTSMTPAGQSSIQRLNQQLTNLRSARTERNQQFWQAAQSLGPRMQSAIGVSVPNPEATVASPDVDPNEQIQAAVTSQDPKQMESAKELAAETVIGMLNNGVARANIENFLNQLGAEAAASVWAKVQARQQK